MAHGLEAPWHVEPSWTGDHTTSPVLAGRFVSTVLPGKSYSGVSAASFPILTATLHDGGCPCFVDEKVN